MSMDTFRKRVTAGKTTLHTLFLAHTQHTLLSLCQLQNLTHKKKNPTQIFYKKKKKLLGFDPNRAIACDPHSGIPHTDSDNNNSSIIIIIIDFFVSLLFLSGFFRSTFAIFQREKNRGHLERESNGGRTLRRFHAEGKPKDSLILCVA